jgi:membrane-associated phospholipid phosphatase
MFVLNGLMIASTVPVGMHFFTDVLGGSAICLLVVAAECCLVRSGAFRAAIFPKFVWRTAPARVRSGAG